MWFNTDLMDIIAESDLKGFVVPRSLRETEFYKSLTNDTAIYRNRRKLTAHMFVILAMCDDPFMNVIYSSVENLAWFLDIVDRHYDDSLDKNKVLANSSIPGIILRLY